VRPGGDAQEGDIVVANVEGETTIKRLRVINGRFVLKPENDSYPLIEKPFEIMGKVVGVVRELNP
ncbi:MAG: S24 family peptidase, partial [candidate division WOR-3 bacterium]